jgi:hypothetical protein
MLLVFFGSIFSEIVGLMRQDCLGLILQHMELFPIIYPSVKVRDRVRVGVGVRTRVRRVSFKVRG